MNALFWIVIGAIIMALAMRAGTIESTKTMKGAFFGIMIGDLMIVGSIANAITKIFLN